MMRLEKIYAKFTSRCNSYRRRVDEVIALDQSSWEFRYLTEVLVSDIWQSWCLFCRELYLASCRGCIARDGSVVVAIEEDHSWKRLSYIACQAKKNQNVAPNGHSNHKIRFEPTWGDVEVFVKIVNNVPLDNKERLLSIFGGGEFSRLKHMQNMRNACAHKNIETLNKISSYSTEYSFSTLEFATDLAWVLCKKNNCLAINAWVDYMEDIADYATFSK